VRCSCPRRCGPAPVLIPFLFGGCHRTKPGPREPPLKRRLRAGAARITRTRPCRSRTPHHREPPSTTSKRPDSSLRPPYFPGVRPEICPRATPRSDQIGCVTAAEPPAIPPFPGMISDAMFRPDTKSMIQGIHPCKSALEGNGDPAAATSGYVNLYCPLRGGYFWPHLARSRRNDTPAPGWIAPGLPVLKAGHPWSFTDTGSGGSGLESKEAMGPARTGCSVPTASRLMAPV